MSYMNNAQDIQCDEPTPLEIVEKTIIREGRALFLVISILAGTIMFCVAMGSVSNFVPDNWGWLAIAVAFVCLPVAFDKLRQSPDPYIIQFARAFRIGFWSILMIVQQLARSQSISAFHPPDMQSTQPNGTQKPS